MNAIRLDRISTVVGFAMALTLGGKADAQLANGQWRLSPQASSGRMAVEVKPQPTVVYTQPGMNSTLFRQPVPVAVVPAILMSDGTVYANVGSGYVSVPRSCSGGVVVGQPRVIGANGVVLQQAAPPTYTQPVPAQATSSQQLLPSVQARAGSAGTQRSQMTQAACYSRDASGRVFAHRR